MKAYDNKTALLKTVLKTVMDPPGALKAKARDLLDSLDHWIIQGICRSEQTRWENITNTSVPENRTRKTEMAWITGQIHSKYCSGHEKELLMWKN